MARDIITKWTLSPAVLRQDGILNRNDPEYDLLDLEIQKVFVQIEKENYIGTDTLYPVLNLVLDLEKIFLCVVMATGTSSVLYHGDDEHTPDIISSEHGRNLIGDRFVSIDSQLLNKCRSEINDLFPELCSLAENNGDESLQEEAFFLLFYLIDVLVSLRVDARILVFNPKPRLDFGLKRLPARDIKDLVTFFRIFEQNNCDGVSLSDNYDVSGLSKEEFLGSEQFNEYCRAHDMLNLVESGKAGVIDVIGRNVVRVSERFEKFSQKSTVNFAMIKGIDDLAGSLTGGISNYMKDFIEILTKICKERERRLVAYSGTNLKEFCTKVIDRRLFGRS